jgi:hypothetical protein
MKNFNYTTNNGTITITGYTGPGGDVTIPDMIDGLPVTSIGNSAFASCRSLFGGCISLTSVTIGNSVTSIGELAFYDCTNLTAITVGPLNLAYSSVGGVLFDKNQATLIQYPGGIAGSYTIPNSVTNIGSYAFGSCTSLTSITIGDGVTNIGRWAFYACTNLTGVYFKGNAPSLGSSVFYNALTATVYYLPGTTGWGPTFGGRPTQQIKSPNSKEDKTYLNQCNNAADQCKKLYDAFLSKGFTADQTFQLLCLTIPTIHYDKD